MDQGQSLTWIESGEAFPSVLTAWQKGSEAPGLLCAGGDLDITTILDAYSHGIFPWFSANQPILWWSPSPRMVLQTRNFKLHRSLKKSLRHFIESENCIIRFDSAFEQVIRHCAGARNKQQGTWIGPSMIEAYKALHTAGFAHSVEVWIDSILVGGLYCVAIGKAVFGESMFTFKTDASKIALAALVSFCLEHDIRMIYSQQETDHMTSLGAFPIERSEFLNYIALTKAAQSPLWEFKPENWNTLLAPGSPHD